MTYTACAISFVIGFYLARKTQKPIILPCICQDEHIRSRLRTPEEAIREGH